jgi:hypothetical protein
VTGADVAALYRILADVSAVLTEAAAGSRTIVPDEQMAWRVGGMAHRLIICDERRLRLHPRLCALGFFGAIRPDRDAGPLEEPEPTGVQKLVGHPGVLSYGAVELPGLSWANLVLHDDPVDAPCWRQSEVLYAEAVELLPSTHYETVRVHNAQLSAGLFDDPRFAVERTVYHDYAGDCEWRAHRLYLG